MKNAHILGKLPGLSGFWSKNLFPTDGIAVSENAI